MPSRGVHRERDALDMSTDCHSTFFAIFAVGAAIVVGRPPSAAGDSRGVEGTHRMMA